MLLRSVLLRMADSPAVERVVRGSPLSGRLVRRFVAGDTMEQALDPVRALNAAGMSVSLDFLGENTHTREDAARSMGYYCALLCFIKERHLNANVSLKLTQLGLDIDEELAIEHMRAILVGAREGGQFVRIDMEGSPYTAATLRLFAALRSDFDNVGVVIQSYLKRSASDLEALIAHGAGVRLVKGAYQEPPSIAFQRKADVDRSFAELAETLLLRGENPAIATHDERLIEHTRAFAAARAIPPERYEFQMLFGIRRDLQERLVGQGHRVRVYTPFGTQWYGYLMRRLAERPANLWFFARNLVRR